MPQTIWLALSAFSAIFVAGVAYFSLRVSDRDLRVIERTSAAQGVWAAPTGGPEDVAPNRGLSNAVQGAIGNLGRAIMASGVLPIATTGMIAVVNPDYISVLFTDHTGNIILGVAVLFLATGMFLMQTIIRKTLS